MSRFEKEYFTMSENDAIEYSKVVLKFFSENAVLTCKEIGDGNLNYVFRIIEEATGKSVIVKQAGPVARISDEFKLSPDRNRIEAEILKLQYELAPGLAPKVYNYDPIMNCCAMEDLSDHVILRTALLKHQKFPKFADHITTFMVNTLLLTTDIVMGHKEKKGLVKSFINPELCEISEDLVYTEPFFDCPRNDIFEPTKAFAKELLWEDKKFLLETAKLKFEFMANAQSLIHGDLHSGSIFVKEDSTKVIDPEFAFYGPAGYDIGNVIAHFIFALVNAEATMEEGTEKDAYIAWIKETVANIVDMFKEKFNKVYDEKATERVAKYEGFKEYYLSSILRDTAAVAGLELCRRTLGLAHVKDVTSIADAEKRAASEKFCLTVGKNLVMNRESMLDGKSYLQLIER
ncbi:S-methyl-5-thioribose kinase [Clostridium swellfunianum]|uniref:S-methyl-5-thioribose kinase n=1 Tax=Clostridium swellfunianum TaxID=1367462 RepID=UPI00202FD42B|nr:S-methyl-5-thioribose kinase [Clostridium swellfunianum]MCM0649238.1 S-methyl-5-thioribose kinase [Clostridium swellfunianum]